MDEVLQGSSLASEYSMTEIVRFRYGNVFANRHLVYTS